MHILERQARSLCPFFEQRLLGRGGVREKATSSVLSAALTLAELHPLDRLTENEKLASAAPTLWQAQYSAVRAS